MWVNWVSATNQKTSNNPFSPQTLIGKKIPRLHKGRNRVSKAVHYVFRDETDSADKPPIRQNYKTRDVLIYKCTQLQSHEHIELSRRNHVMANGFLLFVRWCHRTIYAGDTEEIEKRASAQWKDRLVDRLLRELDFECKASREKWFVDILGSPMVPQTLIMNPTSILELPKHRESLAIRGG